MDKTTPSESVEPPAYLEKPDIRRMFHWLLDRLDNLPPERRARRISRSVNSKHFQTLFEPAEPDDDFVLWELINRCQKEGLIRIKSERKRRDPNLPPWIDMRIEFHIESEPILRQWLNRPAMTPEVKQWLFALKKNEHAFDRPDLLARPVFTWLGKPADEIISRLAAIAELVKDRPLTTYQLSSRLFWGSSKVLKGKEQWLSELLGLPEGAIAQRMLPVEVTFSSGPPTGILMLENLDSYFSACNGNWPGCDHFIKIYTQGFRGAALRIRDPACARLHVSDQSLPGLARLAVFRNEWFRGGSFSYPVYFCGDMDWAGLSIFRALKPVFPGLKPWKTGYERMLRAVEQGCGHSPEMAGKTGQTPVDTSDDAWLDTHVLGYLKTNNRFVDQEVIG